MSEVKIVNPKEKTFEISLYVKPENYDKIKKMLLELPTPERAKLLYELLRISLQRKYKDEKLKNIVFRLFGNFESGNKRLKLNIRTDFDRYKNIYAILKKHNISWTKLLSKNVNLKSVLSEEEKEKLLNLINQDVDENQLKDIYGIGIGSNKLEYITESEKKTEKASKTIKKELEKKIEKPKTKKEETKQVKTQVKPKLTNKEGYFRLVDGNYLKSLSINQQNKIKDFLAVFNEMITELTDINVLKSDNTEKELYIMKVNLLLEDICETLGIPNREQYQLAFYTTMSIYDTFTKYIMKKKENWKDFIKKWYNYYVVSGYIELEDKPIIHKSKLETMLKKRENYFNYVLWNYLLNI
jgi:hypothetical protein